MSVGNCSGTDDRARRDREVQSVRRAQHRLEQLQLSGGAFCRGNGICTDRVHVEQGGAGAGRLERDRFRERDRGRVHGARLRDVEYAGGNGNLYLYSANPSMKNCTIRKSSSYGINLYSSSPLIQNCTITENGTYGIYANGFQFCRDHGQHHFKQR